MCFTKQAEQTNPLFSQIYKYVYMQSNAYENTHLPFIIKDINLFSSPNKLYFFFSPQMDQNYSDYKFH